MDTLEVYSRYFRGIFKIFWRYIRDIFEIFCGDMFEDDRKGVDVDKVKVVELLEVLGLAPPRVEKCQNVYTEKKA